MNVLDAGTDVTVKLIAAEEAGVKIGVIVSDPIEGADSK